MSSYGKLLLLLLLLIKVRRKGRIGRGELVSRLSSVYALFDGMDWIDP